MTDSPTPRPSKGDERGRPKGLTGRGLPVHCAATPDDATESEQTMIEHFLDTLADIATAVAERACKEEG